MKKYIFRSFTAGAVAVFLASFCMAQTDNRVSSSVGDKYMISAKAGGVSYVDGTVTVVRTNGRSGHLIKGDDLEIGDRVSTGADGRAEILLNPGSYARLGGNSSFEFKTTDLDDLQLRLDSGSAMLEVFASDDFRVAVFGPKGKFYLVESGVFRVDILNDGSAKISVWSGKAELTDPDRTILKKGEMATVSGRLANIAKFDRGVKDDLTTWSKTRAKTLASAVAGLKNQGLGPVLMNSFQNGRWNMYHSFGLWMFDASFGGIFLPFGYGWHSPYGYGCGNGIGWYHLPPVVYYPPIRAPSNNLDGRKPPRITTPTGGVANVPDVRKSPVGVTGPSGPSETAITMRDRHVVAPFVRMQQEGGRGSTGGGGGSMLDLSSPGSRGSSPSYSPPTQTYSPPPPPASSPSPASDGARPRKDG